MADLNQLSQMIDLNQISEILKVSLPILFVIIIWTAVWKALALWKSARKNSPIWFIILLIVNTLGILEILYIFIFSKWSKKKQEAIPKSRRTRR